MKFQTLFSVAALAVMLVTPARATTVEGTITSQDKFLGYMGVMDDIKTSPVSGLLPSSAFVFCVQGANTWAGTGARDQYTLGDSFTPYLNSPGTTDKATAMLHYVVDNYYTPLMQGSFGLESGYGFNEAVWQITDFSGSRDSMKVAPDDTPPDTRGAYQLYATIMGDLYDHFDSIAPSYRSSSFNIVFLQDSDSSAQSLALVTPITTAVPEPSTVALMLAGGFGIALRAKRRKPGA